MQCLASSDRTPYTDLSLSRCFAVPPNPPKSVAYQLCVALFAESDCMHCAGDISDMSVRRSVQTPFDQV